MAQPRAGAAESRGFRAAWRDPRAVSMGHVRTEQGLHSGWSGVHHRHGLERERGGRRFPSSLGPGHLVRAWQLPTLGWALVTANPRRSVYTCRGMAQKSAIATTPPPPRARLPEITGPWWTHPKANAPYFRNTPNRTKQSSRHPSAGRKSSRVARRGGVFNLPQT